MLAIEGKVNTAVCYATVIEDEAIEQIRRMCDHDFTAGSKIRIMPDVHAGKGCTIGTTMTITDKVVPGMVGVDIGCGMETVRIAQREIDSEKLDRYDSVAEVLKHGTLSVGFIGLAETLVALTGKHHGEREESYQNLGLEIVGYMRKRMDDESKKTGLNFTLLATPAEGLSGRFVRIDQKKFGKIPGVTDREYYTNSFHVPVYYPISAFEKIKKEAPFHALTNAGHISYVELDGDVCKNLEAFEAIIRYMKEAGVGYGSVNHPVDRDPVCGYTGIIGDECPCCHRHEDGRPFERIRRITGYLVGTMDRWNNAKKAEEADRVKHDTASNMEHLS